MLNVTSKWALLILLSSLLLITQAKAQDQNGWVKIEPNQPSVNLLDRGSAKAGNVQNKGPMPTNTLQVGVATPAITMVSIGFFPTMLTGGAEGFIGNFFTAPADFPTSYFPFFVTGAFAWGTGPPTMVTLAAGVAPGTFMVGTVMWDGFVTAGVAGPPSMTSGFFGGKGIFASTPPTVSTGQGCVCGLRSLSGPGPGVGAVAFPASGGTRARFEFSGPPVATVDQMVSATFVLDNQVAAGCYISGATVPVELQSLTVE